MIFLISKGWSAYLKLITLTIIFMIGYTTMAYTERYSSSFYSFPYLLPYNICKGNTTGLNTKIIKSAKLFTFLCFLSRKSSGYFGFCSSRFQNIPRFRHSGITPKPTIFPRFLHIYRDPLLQGHKRPP